jgi:3-dehydroquinate dehydratase/shikimate dehydrogenase
MPEATLFATLVTPPSSSREELSRLPPGVWGLEVRSDLSSEFDPAALRQHTSRELLYSLRSRTEGGAFEGTARERRDRLLAAAERYDLVELEAERDLSLEVLAHVPAERRVLSWRGPAAGLEALTRRFKQLSRVDARYYVLAPAATTVLDALAPLQLLRRLGRTDVIAFATGPTGSWSRILSVWMGAPVVFGGLEPGTDGTFSVGQLARDYGLPALPPVSELFGILGKAVSRSLSPRLHNASYRALGLSALYLPFHAERFQEFWREEVLAGLDALGTPLRGITVTSPHKEAALEVAASASPLALGSGGANALIWRSGAWRAETTDAQGVVEPLRARGLRLQGQRVAVIGCGGAGRAAAAGLKQAGANVTLVNRGAERGRFASQLLKLPFIPLAEFTACEFALVVNATPCAGYRDEFPFMVEELSREAVVLDLVYGSEPTPLIAAALAQGRIAIDGREVLVQESRGQFHFMTGLQMPTAPLQSLLGESRTLDSRPAPASQPPLSLPPTS